eukprot:3364904-Pyramimonas_sp.AAC.1
MGHKAGGDFGLEEDRERAGAIIKEGNPAFLIAWPACATFTQLIVLLRASSTRGEVTFQRLLAECKVYLAVCVELAVYQHAKKRFFRR